MREDLELFSRNLKMYMDKYEYNQTTLGEKLNTSHSTVAYWVHGVKFPRLSKIDQMCKLFHCERSDLLEVDHTTQTIAEKQQADRLMEYAKRLTPEGVEKVLQYLEDLKGDYYVR